MVPLNRWFRNRGLGASKRTKFRLGQGALLIVAPPTGQGPVPRRIVTTQHKGLSVIHRDAKRPRKSMTRHTLHLGLTVEAPAIPRPPLVNAPDLGGRLAPRPSPDAGDGRREFHGNGGRYAHNGAPRSRLCPTLAGERNHLRIRRVEKTHSPPPSGGTVNRSWGDGKA